MVKSIPHIPFEAIYPTIVDGLNLNTCGDPDCGNYGVAPDFSLPVFKGRGASQRRLLASAANPALSSGLGRYTVSSPSAEGLNRVSRFLEYENNPTAWDDGRVMLCEHLRGNAPCGLQLLVLSNEHLSQERDRLKSQNGLLHGPACGACGRRYLDAPDEFLFNAADVTPCFSSTGCWNPDHRKGTGFETKQVQRRADHRRATRAGGGRVGS